MTAWTLFFNPMPLHSTSLLWLALPLCLAVAIIYKAIRVRNVRRLPREVALLVVYMGAGLTAFCLALWAIEQYWP